MPMKFGANMTRYQPTPSLRRRRSEAARSDEKPPDSRLFYLVAACHTAAQPVKGSIDRVTLLIATL